MNLAQASLVINDIELKLCIDRALSQDKQFIKSLLYASCNNVKNKYQSNLSLSYEQFGIDLFDTFTKINGYSQIVQNLLQSYLPCQKLGHIMKQVNQCLFQLFSFLKRHLTQKADYGVQSLKILQQQAKNQAAGLCNRCSKFILRRDIQQTKILITAGQFNDPYNLYDQGSADFNIRRKQQQSQYKLKYLQVWQNKKKIQQKFYCLQLQNDKRSYDSTNAINEIQKVEQEVKNILLEIRKQYNDSATEVVSQFEQNLIKLVHAVYEKIQKIDRSLVKKDEAIQVGQFQKPKQLEELKKQLDKESRKNHFQNKQLMAKQREISDQNSKIARLTDEFKKCLIEKTTYQTKIKSLLDHQYESGSQITTLMNENKNNAKKIDQLQRQVQRLIFELNKKNTNPSTKNSKSIKILSNGMKSLRLIRNQTNEQQRNKKDEERSKKLVSVHIFNEQNQQFTSSKLKNLNGNNSIQQLVQSKQKYNYDQINENYAVSKKSFKRLAELREQNSKLNIRESAENELQNSLASDLSIQLRRTQKNLEIIRQKSSRRVKNLMKSREKIKKDLESGKQIKQIMNLSLQRQMQKSNFDEKQVKINQQKHEQSAKQVSQQKKGKLNPILKNKAKNQKLEMKSKLGKSMKKINSVHISSKNQCLNPVYNKQKEKIKKQKSLHHSNSSIIRSNLNTTHKFDAVKKQKINNNSVLNSTLPNLNEQNKNIDGEFNQFEKNFVELFKYYQNLLQASITKNCEKLSTNAESLKIQLSNMATFLIFKEKIQNYLMQCVSEHILQIFSKIQGMEKIINQKTGTEQLQKRRTIPKSHVSQIFQQGDRQTTYAYKISKLESNFSNSFYGNNKKGQQNLQTQKILKHKNRLLGIQKNSMLGWWKNSRKNQNLSNQNLMISDIATSALENIDHIKERMLILYFSADQAYRVQKQASIPVLQQKVSPQKTLPVISCGRTLEAGQMGQQQICLLKPQIRYLKLISILLAKLHDKNVAIYQVVKRAVLFPYSYLINGKQFNCHSTRISDGRKTMGSSFRNANQENGDQNFQNGQLSSSLAKLVVLHRKCVIKRDSSSTPNPDCQKCQILQQTQQNRQQPLTEVKGHKKSFSTALKRLSKEINSKKQKQRSQYVCKHLLEFQKQIQHQFKQSNVAQC